jgi:hypothetical protein
MKRHSRVPFVAFVVLSLTIVVALLGSYKPTPVAAQHIIEPTMIAIDGFADDWQDYQPLIADDRGGGDTVDVRFVYGLINNRYFYLKLIRLSAGTLTLTCRLILKATGRENT